MSGAELRRVVDREGALWAVREARGLPVLMTARTQLAAIAIAKQQLADHSGGLLEVYTSTGNLRERAVVEPLSTDTNETTQPYSVAQGSEPGTSSVKWPMNLVWILAAFVTLVFGYWLTPWDAIIQLGQGAGVSAEVQTLMWTAAFYAFPAVAATFASFFIIKKWTGSEINLALALALVFGVAAALSNVFALGLPVELTQKQPLSGPPYVALPIWVITAYINSWGYGLFITALGLGTATAMQVDNWLNGKHSDP